MSLLFLFHLMEVIFEKTGGRPHVFLNPPKTEENLFFNDPAEMDSPFRGAI